MPVDPCRSSQRQVSKNGGLRLKESRTKEARFQFGILDLLLAPLAASLAIAAAISLDILAMDFADWLFGIGWHGRTGNFLAKHVPFLAGNRIVTAGITLALPSIVAVLLCCTFAGFSACRFGIQFAFCIPLVHLWVTSWYLTGDFLWQLHGLHVIAVIPYWVISCISFTLGRKYFAKRKRSARLWRWVCGGVLFGLVASSRFLFLNYVDSLLLFDPADLP